MGLRLNDGGGNHVELTAPTLTSDVSLTLPNSVGTAGQFLQVGAGGATTWATALNLILQTDAVVSEAQVNAAVTVTNPVVLSGTLPYSYAYQWQFKVSGGSSFSNISGATSSTYTIPATIGSDATEAGEIRCVVTVSDSSTPALTITSTSSAVTIAPDIIQGHPGLPYAINTSGAWAAVEVNGSTTTRIRGMAVGYNPSGVRSYVITEGGDIYKGSGELGPYNQAVNSNFAPTSAIYNQGFRNLCLTNNTSGHMGIPYQYTFAAHCIADEDIYVGATNTPGQMNSMRASYPGATTKWITNLGFCSNNAVGLIDDNGTERLINMWTANSALAGANNSTFQDLGLTLPSGRKCKQVCGAYAAGSAAVQGIIILDDQGDLWQVGPCANFIGGVSTGTFANPVQFNPSGMVAMEAITSMGGYTSLAEGFFGKGTNGHLYYVTASQTWGKTLDNVADIPAVSAYGGNALVAMQDGTYRWASGQGALYTTAPASASWTTVNAPTGVTPDASKNKRYPYTHAACSWTNNQSGVIAIPT